MLKALTLVAGVLFLGLGIIGIAVPGLPTTPFLLLAAACFFRSNQKAYRWLLNHRIFGKVIRDYREHKSLPPLVKYSAIGSMWFMVAVSVIFFINALWLKALVVATALIGHVVMARIPLRKS